MINWRKLLNDHLPGRRSSSRQPHWPPIPGRSPEHDGATPTGTPPAEQARVTEAQRELEAEILEEPLHRR